MTVYTRACADIDRAEHALRLLAETHARELASLLNDLAMRYAPGALDSARRSDPTAPLNWSPARWHAFWLDLPSSAEGWCTGSPPLSPPQEQELKALRARLEDLRQQLLLSNHELEQLKEQNAYLRLSSQSKIASPPPLPEQQEAGPQPSPSAQEDAPPPPVALPAQLLEVAFQMNTLTIPPAPLRYESLLCSGADSEQRYRRMVRILYAIARCRICFHLDLERCLAEVDHISSRSSSTRRVIQSLHQIGFLEKETCQLRFNYTSSLVVYRLSASGIEVCRSFEWEPLQNEWDAALAGCEGDQELATRALFFTMHARLRGWKIDLFAPNSKPGLLLAGRDGQSLWVGFPPARPTAQFAEQLAALQNEGSAGAPGICTLDPLERASWVETLRALGVRASATDLYTLLYGGESRPARLYGITPAQPLWLESW